MITENKQITRTEASTKLRERLNEFGLNDWKIRIVADLGKHNFLGKCVYNEKCIYINAHHVDMHPDYEVLDSINHEVAHAIVGPEHGHDDIWKAKAIELGAAPNACANLSLDSNVIDAIRSGDVVEFDITERVVKDVKYTIRRLQDECAVCGKKAIEAKAFEAAGFKITILTCGHLIKKELPKLTPFETLVSNGWKEEIKNCKHVWDKNRCTVCKEFKPYPFQVTGMLALEKALATQRGFGIFDEQGLGKTVEALGLFAFRPDLAPFLWIGKGGIVFQYYNEILRWLGPKYIPQVIQSGKDGILPGLKAYICSYDMLRRMDRKKWAAAGIKTIILDECQNIKNPDSTRTTEVRELVRNVENVIPLSGTPWKNRGSELFVALNMIDPKRCESFKRFVNRWVDYYASGDKYKEGGIRDIKQFKVYFEGCFIRRERSEVLPELPLISRNKFYIQIEDAAKVRYDEALGDFVKLWNQHVLEGTEEAFAGSAEGIGELQKMRHIVGLSKIPATIEFVQEFLEDTNRKITVFVHHKDVGQILKNQLQRLGLAPVFEITSAMDANQRYDVQDRFNTTEKCVLIASTLASGEGLNLQTGSDCIMVERQWNPANEEQAESRFIRIGQLANAVIATYVVAENASIEPLLDNIIEQKREQFHAVMNNSAMPQWSDKDTALSLMQQLANDYKKRGKK